LNPFTIHNSKLALFLFFSSVHYFSKVLTKNGEPLKCPTLDTIDSITILNQVFGISLAQVHGIATIKSADRGIGFNFKLKEAVNIDISTLKNFEFIIDKSVFTGRILLSIGAAPKLGELVLVTVARTGFHLSFDHIRAWLSLFGTIVGELKEIENQIIPGIVEDSIEVLMRLKTHIPSPLPAYGRKLFTRYRGQPIKCGKCMELGHTRRACTSNSSNWMGFVKKLVDLNTIPPLMFGSWYDYLRADESGVNANPSPPTDEPMKDAVDNIL